MLITWRNRILKWILWLLMFGAAGYMLLTPINLCAVDIGRHIKNGELILSGNFDILFKNFYSFTHPDYHFINHHWFFGVLSLAGFKAFGFDGLSLAYVLVMVGGIVLFILAGRRAMRWEGLLFLSALCISVLSDRREIRPEGVSFLLMGLYVYILSLPNLFRSACSNPSQRSCPNNFFANPGVLILLIAQLIWVNTHIFFFMGPLLVAIFWWQASIEGQGQRKSYGWLLAAVTAVNVFNPSGLVGMLTPLNGFNGFGYRLAENQNVFFMMNRFPGESAYKWFLLLIAVLMVGMLLEIKHKGFKKSFPLLVLGVVVAAAGIKAVRLMPFTAAFIIFLCARFYGPWVARFNILGRVLLVTAGIALVAWHLPSARVHAGIGLAKGANASAEFYKQQGLKGAVFSNYDIGGYLIYHLAPEEKVFVDNRQEAFPPQFFNEVYIPMQENNQRWSEELGKWDFQVVYFYRHDLTPWGQQFMVERVKDKDWAPVFVDAYTIIFARRGGVNQAVIDRFELPKSMFVLNK